MIRILKEILEVNAWCRIHLEMKNTKFNNLYDVTHVLRKKQEKENIVN